MLVLGALGAPAAVANHDPEGCHDADTGQELTDGIYPDNNLRAGHLGEFRLQFTSSKAGNKQAVDPLAVSTIKAGTILCGTDPDNQLFYQSGAITLPVPADPVVRCTNPSSSTKYCQSQRSAGYNDLTDGIYMGDGVTDVYCNGLQFLECGGDKTQMNKPVETFVDYNTNDTALLPGYGDKDGNRCLNGQSYEGETIWAVQCLEARGSVFGFDCNADVIYSVASQNDMSAPKMHIYDMHCNDGNNAAEYMMSIENLVICAWAGRGSGEGGCSTTKNPATGTNLNGKAGTWNYALDAYMTDGNPDVDASAVSNNVIWS